MAGSWERISSLSKGLSGIVTRFILGMTIGPLLIALYLLCWIRFKLTALIYCNNSTSLLSSEDVVPLIDIENVNANLNAIILIRGNLSLDCMKELFLCKVLKATDANNRPLFPKFTRYIKICAGYVMWTEESNFNIDDHIRPHSGQPPTNEEQLKNSINELCNRPLSPLKSGWEIIVIPLEYSQSDVPQISTCILFRVHHFITDGISILRLIFEQMAGNHGAFQHVLERMHNKLNPKLKNPFLRILGNLGRIIYMYNFIFNQSHLSISQSNKVFMKYKSKGCKFSESGYIDWSSAIKLDTIRHIKNATSTSVNDVLMSCMAGAFRKYFVTRDISPPDFLKTGIPVSYQGPDDPVEMVNKSYGMVTSMTTGDMDCIQRLKATKVAMDRLKCSSDNNTIRFIQQNCINIIPYRMIKQIAKYSHCNVVFSNMPGPTSKAAFNGCTIESLVPTGLPVRQLGFQVCIVTYAGDVTVAVSVDKARVNSRKDVRQLLDDFVEEVQQLYDSVICSPPSTALEKKID